jgi:hypothetical protein
LTAAGEVAPAAVSHEALFRLSQNKKITMAGRDPATQPASVCELNYT